MHNPKLILDYVYDHEAAQPDEVLLVQPVGDCQVVEYTWRQMLDEARRMAAHLKSRDFEPGARVAILSKNCAHFFMAELAVWMAGGTSVAIFPTESATRTCFLYRVARDFSGGYQARPPDRICFGAATVAQIPAGCFPDDAIS